MATLKRPHGVEILRFRGRLPWRSAAGLDTHSNQRIAAGISRGNGVAS
jgi:hypothetical protein